MSSSRSVNLAGAAAPGPSRAWVFTWNNPGPDSMQTIEARRSEILVLNAGWEGLTDGRTPHLQGHIVLKSPRRLSQLTAWFPGVHFEPRRGSEAQAREYTEKEGNPGRVDWDDRHQGSRTDIAAMTTLIASNPIAATREVAAQMPHMFVKFHAGVTALARALLPPTPLLIKRNVRWHYGPTGTGKTHTALCDAQDSALHPDDIFIWSISNLKFAGTYAGQTHVVIDELRTTWEHFSFSALLALLGNSRHEVEVKGGTVPWRATHIWVTCPVPPSQFCAVVGDPIDQLLRRISTTREFAVPYVEDAAPDAPAFISPSQASTIPLPQPAREQSPELLPRGPKRLRRTVPPSLPFLPGHVWALGTPARPIEFSASECSDSDA